MTKRSNRATHFPLCNGIANSAPTVKTTFLALRKNSQFDLRFKFSMERWGGTNSVEHLPGVKLQRQSVNRPCRAARQRLNRNINQPSSARSSPSLKTEDQKNLWSGLNERRSALHLMVSRRNVASGIAALRSFNIIDPEHSDILIVLQRRIQRDRNDRSEVFLSLLFHIVVLDFLHTTKSIHMRYMFGKGVRHTV